MARPQRPRSEATPGDASYIATANPEAIQKLLAERDAFLEARTSLIEENGHLYDEIADLRHALTLCVASLDQLLPYLAKVPADVGLLNDALMAARPLLESEGPDYPDGCDKDGFPGGCERMGCKGKCQ